MRMIIYIWLLSCLVVFTCNSENNTEPRSKKSELNDVIKKARDDLATLQQCKKIGAKGIKGLDNAKEFKRMKKQFLTREMLDILEDGGDQKAAELRKRAGLKRISKEEKSAIFRNINDRLAQFTTSGKPIVMSEEGGIISSLDPLIEGSMAAVMAIKKDIDKDVKIIEDRMLALPMIVIELDDDPRLKELLDTLKQQDALISELEEISMTLAGE